MISNLREARLKLKLSQEKLANLVNVSRETIRNIENGTSIPNVLLAISIANVVGWAVSDLFKETDNKKGN